MADHIWTVDSGPHQVAMMDLPVRMTVVRLRNGDLFLHSPTRFTNTLADELHSIGRVRHLVAPSIAHWSYIQQWQQALPAARCWAVPGLGKRWQVRRSGLRIDYDLSDSSPAVWQDEIEQRIVPGAFGFCEAVFFHRPSRTLLLTDLVQNLETGKLSRLMAAAMRLAGSTAPCGKAPIYLRAAVMLKRSRARRAMREMLAHGPEQLIFTHGRTVDHDAAAFARKSLDWLVS